MKRSAAIVLLLMLSASLRAQTSIVLHDSVWDMHAQPPYTNYYLGRDYWFTPPYSPSLAMPTLLISSPVAATAYLQLGSQAPHAISLSGGYASFQIPSKWIITKSDTIQNTAIHIWCDTADLSVLFSGDNALTLPPRDAWDTSY